MIPYYTDAFIDYNAFNRLFEEVEWLSKTPVRRESFMSHVPLEYTYGSGRGVRTYTSTEFHPLVEAIMNKINYDRGRSYNVCFLNLYLDETNHLGWHSDDSPEMDAEHPIGVISFGQAREIWWREIGAKGVVPEENRQLLDSGSLFEMPAGFQALYEHKIPKGSFVGMTPRISLTFRKYKIDE
jgi:alkylated DNA repair dioxygenase AlkB